MVDGQSNQAKYVLKQLEVCVPHPEEAGILDKRQRKMTDKGREYRKKILDKKRTNLVSRINRKSVEIDVLLHSHQNVTVKKELAQLSEIFNCTEELWFTDIDEKVFSFKHKIHNWLREGVEMQEIEKKSR